MKLKVLSAEFLSVAPTQHPEKLLRFDLPPHDTTPHLHEGGLGFRQARRSHQFAQRVDRQRHAILTAETGAVTSYLEMRF